MLIKTPIKILLINSLFLVDIAAQMEYPGKKNSSNTYGINTAIYLFIDGVDTQTNDIIASKITKMMSALYDRFMQVFLKPDNS